MNEQSSSSTGKNLRLRREPRKKTIDHGPTTIDLNNPIDPAKVGSGKSEVGNFQTPDSLLCQQLSTMDRQLSTNQPGVPPKKLSTMDRQPSTPNRRDPEKTYRPWTDNYRPQPGVIQKKPIDHGPTTIDLNNPTDPAKVGSGKSEVGNFQTPDSLLCQQLSTMDHQTIDQSTRRTPEKTIDHGPTTIDPNPA